MKRIFCSLLCEFTEKAMAPHSSTLAWKIPWTEEPGGLQSMGSLRVGCDSATSLSLFIFIFHFHALEKEMATHFSVLAWRILGMAEPGGLPSMGSHRVGHDWSDLAAAAAACEFTGLPWWLSGKESACQRRRHRLFAWVRKIPQRKKWQPNPVFLPGKSHGKRSLAGLQSMGSQSWTQLSN